MSSKMISIQVKLTRMSRCQSPRARLEIAAAVLEKKWRVGGAAEIIRPWNLILDNTSERIMRYPPLLVRGQAMLTNGP